MDIALFSFFSDYGHILHAICPGFGRKLCEMVEIQEETIGYDSRPFFTEINRILSILVNMTHQMVWMQFKISQKF